MQRNVSSLTTLFLILIIIAGMWLADYSDVGLFPGLLIAFGAICALIMITRHENSLPLEYDEREAWEIMRAKGKRHYLVRSVMSGFFIGLIFLLYQLIRVWWSGESFTANSVFILAALFIILYIGGSYYAAVRKWALYEERYKESISQGTQHNNSFNRSAR